MRDQPTYQDVERAMDDKGVGYNYAWDLPTDPSIRRNDYPIDATNRPRDQPRPMRKHNWY